MARREARRRLEVGGPAVAAHGDAGEASGADDFVLPADIDPSEVAGAIPAKLNEGRHSRPERSANTARVMNKRRDGKVVVPAEVLQRLGGRRVLDQIVSEIRARRVLPVVRKYTG